MRAHHGRSYRRRHRRTTRPHWIRGTDMTITSSRIAAVSGLCAAAAGALFIGVQIGHPHLDSTSIQSTEVVIRSTLKLVMALLALVGITGMYLSQVDRNGRLGLVGFVVLAIGYLCIAGTAFTAAF